MEEKKCIICGNKARFDLCIDCYNEKNQIKKDLDGSTNTLDDTKDYYNNLKYNTFKLNNLEYAKTACLKIIALGEILEETYELKGYSKKAKEESSELLKKKIDFLNNKKANKKEETIVVERPVVNDGRSAIVENETDKEDVKDYRRLYPMCYRCKDGHYVRSKSERIIDDALFDMKLIHVYEKRVVNENNDEEYYPDFYLPYEAKGIFIEFFGLENDKKYMQTEKKKLDYYKSKEYDVIEVREKNISLIAEYLEDEIRRINKKYK